MRMENQRPFCTPRAVAPLRPLAAVAPGRGMQHGGGRRGWGRHWRWLQTPSSIRKRPHCNTLLFGIASEGPEGLGHCRLRVQRGAISRDRQGEPQKKCLHPGHPGATIQAAAKALFVVRVNVVGRTETCKSRGKTQKSRLLKQSVNLRLTIRAWESRLDYALVTTNLV